jgi:hypothetical protein
MNEEEIESYKQAININSDQYKKLGKEYKEKFKNMNDEQLIDSINGQVGNSGWGNARMLYTSALHKELENRNLDYSDIGNKEALSFAKKVKLVGKKLEISKLDD